MNKILVLLFFIVLLSCKWDKKDKSIKENEKIEIIQREHPKTDATLLNGIWAENEIENALFEIDKDTLRYVEFYEKSYLCYMKKKYLIIENEKNEQISSDKILKLNKDSLILKTSENEIIRLYKRFE